MRLLSRVHCRIGALMIMSDNKYKPKYFQKNEDGYVTTTQDLCTGQHVMPSMPSVGLGCFEDSKCPYQILHCNVLV